MKQIGSANPFDGIRFGDSGKYYCPTPTLIDFNGDGKIDALVGNRDGLLNYCINAGTATSPSYSCTTSYEGAKSTNPAGNPFISIDIKKADRGGVVTPGGNQDDHSYTKPFAVDVVSLIFVTLFKYLFARH